MVARALILVVAMCMPLANASCTAQNDCATCLTQEGGLFGSVDCGYCTSTGECTTSITSSCNGGEWISHSSICTSCSPSCPAPPAPPPATCDPPSDPAACNNGGNDCKDSVCQSPGCIGSGFSASGGHVSCFCLGSDGSKHPVCSTSTHADEVTSSRRLSEKPALTSNIMGSNIVAGSRRLSENPPPGGGGLCLGGPNCLCAGGQVANVCLLVWVVLGLIVAVILVPICCFCGLCMSCGFAAGGCCKQQTQAVHVYGNQPSNGAQYLLPHQQKELSGGE